ncbi:TonB-dependent receptor [Lacihabitans soyangensis]|uniref:TonB-dependent receptor n=1 Tax=Lacihabitans soyangensis TaxID=869394 RepID=A0AAE3H7P7_9BACT|nr:TonB-dependent receptor [Lacihabitans soyangensis]MCP9765641.1 TonB-dependent receptor [Lacihabitans soyangensis]
MRNLLSSLFFLVINLSAVCGQQVIKGRVVDDVTQSPLPGASISILNTQLGTQTDVEGNFRIQNAPFGRQTLKVSYVGYQTSLIPNILIAVGKEVVLNITLKESLIIGEEVVVSGNRKLDKTLSNNEMTAVSARSFNIEDTRRYAGSLGDPSRMAANFAGVAPANDSRNDIVVRGNSPSGLLWQMEGLNINSPNHFGAFGTTGGPVSMLNNNVLDKSDFMTGAFPSSYGNALSGVFDLKMRSGNKDKYEFLGQIGFNGIELGTEGPISKTSKATYLLNYRYTTLGLFNKVGINFGTGDAIPIFQDLNFKIDSPTGKKGKVSLFGILGKSNVDFLGNSLDSLNIKTNFYANENQNTRTKYKAITVGLIYEYRFSPSWFSKLSIGLSGNEESVTLDSIGIVNRNAFLSNELYFSQNKWMLAYLLTKKINPKTSLTSGVTIDFLSFELSQIDYFNEAKSARIVLGTKDNTTIIQAYSSLRHYFTQKLSTRIGLHFLQLMLNNMSVLEPRASLTYELSPTQSLSFGYGLHSQMQPLTSYFAKTYSMGSVFETNRNLDFTKSHQFVMTFDNNLGENLRLKVEAYYQRLSKVPVEQRSSPFSMLNQGSSFAQVTTDSLVNEGSGSNTGLELTLERFFSKGMYFLITTSLFDSKYKGSDGIERNTAFNGNYVLTFLGGKEWNVGKKSTVGISIKYGNQGGRYFTPIDFEASRIKKEAVYVNSLAHSVKQKNYSRFDLRLTCTYDMRKIRHEWSIDLQNVFNTQNVFSEDYNVRTNQIVTQYQQGFFPVPTYRILF